MNRRGFFGAVAAFVASIMMLPKWLKAIEQPVDYVTEANASLADWAGLPSPIVFGGDAGDPRYHRAGRPNVRRDGKSCYLNGDDVTNEAYECYEGEDGWCNRYLRTGDGRDRIMLAADGKPIRYATLGKVEWRRDNPIDQLLTDFVAAHQKAS